MFQARRWQTEVLQHKKPSIIKFAPGAPVINMV